jgi:hypothetical protein
MEELMKTSKVTLLALAAMALAAGSAQAGITDPGLTITATNANGTGTYQVFLSNGTWTTNSRGDDVWSWTSPAEGYQIFDDNFNVVADIPFMQCEMVSDPQVTVNFSVNATALSTHFAITTGLLTFPSGIGSGAIGRATAGVTVTDNDGDGASATGGFGGFGYRANYNGTIPTGTTFSNLLSGPVVAAADDSATLSDSTVGYPGYVPIGGAVNSMQAKFDFTLSPNDSASGTSFYEIIPSPASLSFLAGAGLIGFARRRRA